VSLERELIQITTEVNNLRQLEYIIRSDEFQQAYTSTTNKVEAEYYIQARDCDALKHWIRAQKLGDLESYTVRELRVMAKDLKVRDYHLLSKNELVTEIHRCRSGENSLKKSLTFTKL
jgi:hypothetical protein